MQRRVLFALPILALVLSANLAFADNATTNQSLLNFAYSYAICKVNFTTMFVGNVSSVDPSLAIALNGQAGILRQGASYLDVYVSSDNVPGFRSYMQGSFDPQLNNVSTKIHSDILSANLSSNTLARLKTYYQTDQGFLATCENAPAKKYADQVLSNYNADEDRLQNQITVLASKNVSTSNLTSLLASSESQIIVPLQNAISNATNSSQISHALSTYCLLDGCKSGTNFHLDAKFALQKLNLLDQKILVVTNASTQAQISADLSTASSTLATVGASAYQNNQEKIIWNNLTAASSLIQHEYNLLRINVTKVISKYNQILDNYQNQVSKLSASINTSSLSALLTNATNEIIVPLQQNPTPQNARTYCLLNDCTNGNFHLDAQFSIDALAQAIAKAQTYNSINLTALSAAQEDLSNATNLVSETGTQQYSASVAAQIWININNTKSEIKYIIIHARGKANHTTISAVVHTNVSVHGNASITSTTIHRKTNSSANVSITSSVSTHTNQSANTSSKSTIKSVISTGVNG